VRNAATVLANPVAPLTPNVREQLVGLAAATPASRRWGHA
jgi:hypothetical protein